MKEDDFIGFVQSRARVPTRNEAVAVTRAVLNTLTERIEPDDARHLASQLPREISAFVERETFASGQRFSFHDFCQRVADREQSDPQIAAVHARSVFETLEDALSTEEILRLRSLLPDDYSSLFSTEIEEPEESERPEPDARRIRR